jgi:hypothetical protein
MPVTVVQGQDQETVVLVQGEAQGEARQMVLCATLSAPVVAVQGCLGKGLAVQVVFLMYQVLVVLVAEVVVAVGLLGKLPIQATAMVVMAELMVAGLVMDA